MSFPDSWLEVWADVKNVELISTNMGTNPVVGVLSPKTDIRKYTVKAEKSLLLFLAA
jgi:hypothetical protein